MLLVDIPMPVMCDITCPMGILINKEFVCVGTRKTIAKEDWWLYSRFPEWCPIKGEVKEGDDNKWELVK